MFIRAIVFVTLLLDFSDSNTRSVSLVVKHRQEFGTRDIDDRDFIQIPDYHEDVLNFQHEPKYPPEHPGVKKKESKYTSIIELFKQGAYREQNKATSNKDMDETEDTDTDLDVDVDRYFGSEYLVLLDKSLDIKSSEIENNKNDKSEVRHVRASIVDINDEECSIESLSCLHKLYGLSNSKTKIMRNKLEKLHKLKRHKREAREQWRNSLPGSKQEIPKETEPTEPDDWEEVTDADLEKAKLNTYTQVMEYAGWTLLSAVIFIFIGLCFIRDPIACIFAFGTGCPCCLICCPCIRSFTDKYLDTKRIVREQMNRYMPGIIVNDDGSLDFYEPTADELDILMEIIDEMQG